MKLSTFIKLCVNFLIPKLIFKKESKKLVWYLGIQRIKIRGWKHGQRLRSCSSVLALKKKLTAIHVIQVCI